MFKILVWTAAVASTGAAVMFVPIDPSILRAVGLYDAEHTGFAREAAQSGVVPLSRQMRIVSSSETGSKMEIRVIRADGDAGQAQRTTTTTERLPIPAAPRVFIHKAPQVASVASNAPRNLKHVTAPVSRTGIIRNLQTELRRVGCYSGRVDGDWGPASRFAMASFIKSVNAALPTEKPDMILLSLVRRHQSAACGRGNSEGSTVANVGRADVRAGNWQARVAPAAGARTTTVERPRRAIAATHRQQSTPRIVRTHDRDVPSVSITPSTRVAVTPDPQRPSSDFSATRMSLGVAPRQEPHVTPRSVTVNENAGRPAVRPRPTRRTTNRRSSTRRSRERTYRAPRTIRRVQRTSRRRRYSSRRRSRNWKQQVLGQHNMLSGR